MNSGSQPTLGRSLCGSGAVVVIVNTFVLHTDGGEGAPSGRGPCPGLYLRNLTELTVLRGSAIKGLLSE